MGRGAAVAPAFSLMDLSFFTSSAGRALLHDLAAADLRDSNTLALITALRRTVPPELARDALTLARLRRRAAEKFTRADVMFFTPDALEQSSGALISRWCAARFAGYDRIADLGCGVGGDSLALAAVAPLIGVDRDALRLQMARLNLAAYDLCADLLQADLFDPLPFRGVPAAFFDPARRVGERRVFSVRDYIPPLDIITRWRFDALAVKLSPGVDLAELQPYSGAGVEFISVDGALKEAVLWLGGLAFPGFAASRLDHTGAGESLFARNLPPPPLSDPLAYLLEPDPAVIRAGLFGELADQVQMPLFRLDETIAYLTSASPCNSPWARVWPIREWMPFQLKRLRAALRARGIGRVTVKKRGSPITPEELIKQLRLDGTGEAAVVVLTRVAGQPAVLICGEML